MPDIKTLGILTVNCNTVEMKEADSPEKCKTNTGQEIDTTEKHYTNTDSSKFEIEDNSMVSDTDNNNIKSFLPGSNSAADKKASDEITKQLQREFKDVFNGIR